MSSVVRTVLGAAIVVTSASVAMAQSAPQTGASTAAPGNAPAAYQSVQTSASAPVVAPGGAAVVAAAPKPQPKVADKSDMFGGNDPNSLAGTRAFWETQNTY